MHAQDIRAQFRQTISNMWTTVEGLQCVLHVSDDSKVQVQVEEFKPAGIGRLLQPERHDECATQKIGDWDPNLSDSCLITSRVLLEFPSQFAGK